MGTMQLMAPFLAIEGETMKDSALLRSKSPEPPMPFMRWEPQTWVELTWP